jgi:hypothetical protein
LPWNGHKFQSLLGSNSDNYSKLKGYKTTIHSLLVTSKCTISFLMSAFIILISFLILRINPGKKVLIFILWSHQHKKTYNHHKNHALNKKKLYKNLFVFCFHCRIFACNYKKRQLKVKGKHRDNGIWWWGYRFLDDFESLDWNFYWRLRDPETVKITESFWWMIHFGDHWNIGMDWWCKRIKIGVHLVRWQSPEPHATTNS